MHHLPQSTVKLLSSTQVITSTYSVVKELLENSLDAGATNIEIKLENYGLDKIEIRDNGCGVPKEDVIYMAQAHYTSKLTTTEDLENLDTYGFRGEALGAICTVADVTITTKTKDDDISTEYKVDNKGIIHQSKPSHLGQGTTVSVSNIFKNIPVRKQFHNNIKRKKETLKQIEDVVLSYGVIYPQVRLVLKHNKDTLWQKNLVSDTKNVLHSIFGSSVMNQLQHVERAFTDPAFEIDAYLPSYNCNTSDTHRSTIDRTFIFVNNRPVQLKFVEKLLKHHYSSSHGVDPPKYPLGFFHIRTSSKEVDVNVDPNKTQVMLHNKDELEISVEEMLHELYRSPEPPMASRTETNPSLINPPLPGLSSIETANIETVKTNEKCNYVQPLDTSVEDVFGMEMDVSDDLLLGQIDINSANKNTKYIPSKEDRENDLEILKTDLVVSVKNRCGVSESVIQNTDNVQPKEDIENDVKIVNTDLMGSVANSCGVSESLIKDITMRVTEKEIDLENNSNNIRCIDNNTVKHVNNGHLTHNGSDLFNDTSHNIHQNNALKVTADKDSGVNQKNSVLSKTSDNMLNGKIICDSFNSTKEDNFTLDSSVVTSTAKQKGDKPDFNVSGDFDDLLLMDIDTPTKVTTVDGGGSLPGWSRGTSVHDNEGAVVQPVQLLIPKGQGCNMGEKTSGMSLNESRNNDNNTSSFHKTDLSGQVTLYDLLGSEKNQSTPKCKDLKLQSLPSGAKPQLSSKRRKLDNSKLKEQSVQKLFSPSRASHKASSKQETPVKSVTVAFSMNSFKTNYHHNRRRQKKSGNSDEEQLIGTVQSSLLWIVVQRSKLILFQPVRAKELLIYESLLDCHALPLEPLDNPIVLHKSTFQKESHWDILLSMKKVPGQLRDCYTHYTDERLVKNGFQIRQYIGQNNENEKLEIVSMTNCMNFFGIKDLTDILEKVTLATKETGSYILNSCRSIKIQHYLQGEAVRMSRTIPAKFSKKDCLDLLECLKHRNMSQQCITNLTTTCFHNKPYFLDLYDMQDLAHSQTSLTDSQNESSTQQESL